MGYGKWIGMISHFCLPVIPHVSGDRLMGLHFILLYYFLVCYGVLFGTIAVVTTVVLMAFFFLFLLNILGYIWIMCYVVLDYKTHWNGEREYFLSRGKYLNDKKKISRVLLYSNQNKCGVLFYSLPFWLMGKVYWEPLIFFYSTSSLTIFLLYFSQLPVTVYICVLFVFFILFSNVSQRIKRFAKFEYKKE